MSKLNQLRRSKDVFLVAGPCSAESEEQLLQTAKTLIDGKMSLFRAGIWKPRTQPGAFEGVGEEGLQWLQTVKNTYNIPITTEVANPHHVELALKYDIDVLWIGARTTVNPFVIQEIAESLAGVDIPVMIKNPVNPDLSLWKGSVERFLRVGVTDIALIHRGFSVYQKTRYRNNPQWQIPIAMKAAYPDFMMICDPSHIGGTRDLIAPISQQSLNYNFDGLMIETHPDPDHALSDAQQQITPDALNSLIDTLSFRIPDDKDTEYHQELDKLRYQIDAVDQEIWHQLAHRLEIVKNIGELKKDHNVALLQPSRWEELTEKGRQFLQSQGFSESFIEKFMSAIHEESLEQQNQIINPK